MNKIRELEKRVKALENAQGTIVNVRFDNGQARKMRLPDVIPLLKEGDGPKVVDVTGEARPEDGRLLDIIKAIVEEIPE